MLSNASEIRKLAQIIQIIGHIFWLKDRSHIFCTTYASVLKSGHYFPNQLQSYVLLKSNLILIPFLLLIFLIGVQTCFDKVILIRQKCGNFILCGEFSLVHSFRVHLNLDVFSLKNWEWYGSWKHSGLFLWA